MKARVYQIGPTFYAQVKRWALVGWQYVRHTDTTHNGWDTIDDWRTGKKEQARQFNNIEDAQACIDEVRKSIANEKARKAALKNRNTYNMDDIQH